MKYPTTRGDLAAGRRDYNVCDFEVQEGRIANPSRREDGSRELKSVESVKMSYRAESTEQRECKS